MNRIKELRKLVGMTAKELADILGISQSMLTNYENGSSTPREYSVWRKISDQFNVSISYLMGLTDVLDVANNKNDHTHYPDYITINPNYVMEEYISSGKPIEFQVKSLEEYALLANISQFMALGNEDVKTLLTTVQSLIREDFKGRCTEFRLSDENSN